MTISYMPREINRSGDLLLKIWICLKSRLFDLRCTVIFENLLFMICDKKPLSR